MRYVVMFDSTAYATFDDYMSAVLFIFRLHMYDYQCGQTARAYYIRERN